MEDVALNEELETYANNRPKAVKLGTELWKKLEDDGRITIKNDLPYLDDDIAILSDDELLECEHTFLFPNN